MANMRFFLGLVLCLTVSRAMAQDDKAAVTDKVNALLGTENTIALQRKTLIIEGFREGIKVKVDKVNYFDLDPASVVYSPVDAIVSVSCHGDVGECVERHLLIDGEKNLRKRVAFGMTDAAKAEQLVTELRTLLEFLQKK